MTIVVGHPINRRARGVLHLAAMLARSGHEDLQVCVVQPAPWVPGTGRADHEYRDYLVDASNRALEQARADLPAGVSAQFRVVTARSTSSGLVQAAQDCGAGVVAVGSSQVGHFGHIALSSVADRLLHSSPVPVAIAPWGFRADNGGEDPDVGTVQRVTLAYTGTRTSAILLDAAEALAERFGSPLRLASFAVTHAPPGPARFRAENADLTNEWTADIRAAVAHARSERGSPRAGELEVVLGYGESWKEAFGEVEWRAGDLLVVGSSESGPLASVFLGSRATKIMRYSPVPVLAIPRAAAATLAQP